MRKNIAVILAGGSGERSGFDIPKQMMKLAGKPIVEHTISAFENSAAIDEIISVTAGSPLIIYCTGILLSAVLFELCTVTLTGTLLFKPQLRLTGVSTRII
jgi:CTP:molybdopterin cytidylyltransferase MocA